MCPCEVVRHLAWHSGVVKGGGEVMKDLLAGQIDLMNRCDPRTIALLTKNPKIEVLRSPGGCPWDAEQTHASLIQYLVEECYELIDAIEAGNRDEVLEELGDVLYQVIFHSDLDATGTLGLLSFVAATAPAPPPAASATEATGATAATVTFSPPTVALDPGSTPFAIGGSTRLLGIVVAGATAMAGWCVAVLPALLFDPAGLTLFFTLLMTAVVGFTAAQVQALTTAQVQALSTTQVAAMETRDVAALKTSQVAALTTDQVQTGLTTAQVVGLTVGQVASLTTDQVVALTTTQVAAMETRDVAALTTAQVAALTTDQVNTGLTTAQVAALTTAQVAALTTDQVQSGLTTAQVVGLTTTQVAALTTDQVRVLTTDQVAALILDLARRHGVLAPT